MPTTPRMARYHRYPWAGEECSLVGLADVDYALVVQGALEGEGHPRQRVEELEPGHSVGGELGGHLLERDQMGDAQNHTIKAIPRRVDTR